MLKEDVNDKRKERHDVTQEDFTPENVCAIMFEGAEELYTDFSKTMLDPCCGIGNLLLYALKHRIKHCKTADDLYAAVSTLYGTELMDDNVAECKENFINILRSSKIPFDEERMMSILNSNIICTDSNDWDYENWRPKPKYTTQELF